MRVAVLCNHPLGIPAIDFLLGKELLVGIGCPAIPGDHLFRMQMLAQEKQLAFGIIDENDQNKTLGAWLKQCNADVVFVFTFPFKINKDCLRIPRQGFFNFHTGLLPVYRGGDPIFWQVFAQESEGGISVHLMDEKFDHGPVVHVEKVEIQPEDTYGQHIQKLALTNRNACQKVIENFDQLTPTPQDDSSAAYQNKPSFFNLIIDWEKYNALTIKALVRAANPIYGGAISFFRGVPVHFLQVAIGSTQNPPNVAPGTIVSAGKDGIIVLTSDKKLLRADVLYTEDGFFTGGKLATTFSIKDKEQFVLPDLPNPEQLAQAQQQQGQ